VTPFLSNAQLNAIVNEDDLTRHQRVLDQPVP
jgi:hypothetical protein